MYNERIKKLTESLCDNESVYIKNPENVYYYSGFSGEGALFVSKNERKLITDFRYIYDAEKSEAYGYEIFNIKDGIENAVSKDTEVMYLEGDYVTLNFYNDITKKLPHITIQCENFVSKPREVKCDYEIENITKASKIAERAFGKLLKLLDTNISEKQLANEFEYLVKKDGARGVSFDTIVASGVNSSMPHAVPTDKKPQKGDFITFDFGCIYNGYCSDMTRTVALGSVSDKMKNVYDIVLKAQLKGLESIKKGVKCSEADSVARSVIEKAGYKEQFGHALGHGVGLYIHEEPRLSPKCDTVLENNMVVTVEPGIYIANEFGVRIEDLVVVNEENPCILTKFEKNLIII